MSDDDNSNHEKLFSIETAKQGRALCKKCKRKCQEGELRVAKIAPNPLGSGKIKTWHHIDCIFEVFLKQRQTTKRIEDPRDVEGWDLLNAAAKVDILKKIKECNKAFEAMHAKKSKNSRRKSQLNDVSANEDTLSVSSLSTHSLIKHGTVGDNSFREFRTVVANVSNAKNSQEKINIFHNMFHKGSDGISFKGDLVLWCKLLLPSAIKRNFHIQKDQLIKIFGRIFGLGVEAIKENLKKNELGQTIKICFEKSKNLKPAHLSTLTISDVDEFLDVLSYLSEEEDFFNHFNTFVEKCTSNDLKVIIRLVYHDLLMKAGAKHVFEAIHPKAYRKFQSCHDIKTAINACRTEGQKDDKQETRESAKSVKSPKRKRATSILDSKPKRVKTEEIVKTELTISETNEPTEGHKSFPNYFKNVKLGLEEGVSEKYTEWIRYFIAYGGTVLKNSEFEKASHVLHLNDTISEPTIQSACNSRHVIIEWIKDTVTKECLQDFRPYTVRWKPSFKQ